MKYIKIPKSISFNISRDKKFSLSPHDYESIQIKNKNIKKLGDVTEKAFFKGRAISRKFFTSNSNEFLITNSALQTNEYFISTKRDTAIIPIVKPENVDCISNKSLLLSINANVGQVSYFENNNSDIKYTISPWMINFKPEENFFYILGILKSKFFREQIKALTPIGTTLSNSNQRVYDAQIPFPNKKKEKTIEYFELLVKAVLEKEREIRQKHELLKRIIDKELNENQKMQKFEFSYPKYKEMKHKNRINAGFWDVHFRRNEFLVSNYKNGTKDLKSLGFSFERGQNLQISAIGKSLYSDERKENFYTLIFPKNLSIYGTVIKYEYLGNKKELKILKKGDLIFGAEGFEKGRSLVIVDEREKTITNIHGITLNQNNDNLILSIFVKCYFDYLRDSEMIDLYSVGGNGGSLAQKYLEKLPIPNFPKKVMKNISLLYHSKQDAPSNIKIQNFCDIDIKWNKKAGILELDNSIEIIKNKLELLISDIILDKEIEQFDLDFY